jgi:hypothetical protein
VNNHPAKLGRDGQAVFTNRLCRGWRRRRICYIEQRLTAAGLSTSAQEILAALT